MRGRGDGTDRKTARSKKRIKKAKEERATIRGKIDDLFRKLANLNDRIEAEAEGTSNNMTGSWGVIRKEFERYCKERERDENGEI